ncbi:MAG: M1 family metallopeptidase [Alphaproteobacteria bacterium]|nr:M1 family metallopeptidase [Alphaproteobacteria bacterium]
MTKPTNGLLLAALLMLPGCAHVTATPAPAPKAAPAAARYNPLKAFTKLTLPQAVNSYRAGNGAPGPAYWQNRADYTIRAHLLPAQKELTASEVITYTNNSPETLGCLWLRLEQNAYRKYSRASFAEWPQSEHTEGFQFDSVAVDEGGKTTKADYRISDTRMQIPLEQPLKPHGKLRVLITYHYTIPGKFGGRTAWANYKDGAIYDVAQWYPRMAVFDDLRGWDTQPYLGNEFYLEYGDFDYAVTVPADMLVAGGGELLNPKEVLTATERARLAEAAKSDKTVAIRGTDEIGNPSSRPKTSGELTWRFHMKNTRDVAFSASAAFIWDAARIDLPDGKHALAMSFYPRESLGKNAWPRSTQYVKDAVENFSRRWFPYPWPTAINIAGPASGMEYPGMAFDGVEDKNAPLFWITAHELGHSWFPMIVGFNERRNAWMDEGFNTFIDTYESDDFNHGEWGPKRDSEFAPQGGYPADDIETVLKDKDAPPIVTRADAIKEKYRHPVTYFKTALGLKLLREQILGPERFDFAFRKFIRDWAYRHPSPSDFFRAMDSAGGEDLAWFWRGWFFNNWNADLAVKKVTYNAGDPTKGATVTVSSLDRLILPATLQVDFTDGTKDSIRIPAEAWIQKTEVSVPVYSTKKIAQVVLDPDHAIPDADRGNNELKGPF